MSLDKHSKRSIGRVKLPKPDFKNMAALSSNLPNKPILPWNHYDSPWLEPENEAEEKNNTVKSTDKDSQEPSERGEG